MLLWYGPVLVTNPPLRTHSLPTSESLTSSLEELNGCDSVLGRTGGVENKEDCDSSGACFSGPLEILGSLESWSLLVPLGFLGSTEALLGLLRCPRDPGVIGGLLESFKVSRISHFLTEILEIPETSWSSWSLLRTLTDPGDSCGLIELQEVSGRSRCWSYLRLHGDLGVSRGLR